MNGWIVFGYGGFFSIFQLSGGLLIPDLMLHYSPEKIETLLQAYGSQARLYYLRYQFRDFLYPIVYGSFMMGILVRLIRPTSMNFWIFVPWFAVFFDFLENAFLRLIFYDYPQIVNDRVQIAAWMTSFKWLFVLISFVLMIIAFRHRRIKYMRRLSHKESELFADEEE
jgi:hypothetical protein